MTYKWISFILSTNCQSAHHIDWDIIGMDGHIHASKSNHIRHFNIPNVMQTMNSGMPWCYLIGPCLRRQLFNTACMSWEFDLIYTNKITFSYPINLTVLLNLSSHLTLQHRQSLFCRTKWDLAQPQQPIFSSLKPIII